MSFEAVYRDDDTALGHEGDPSVATLVFEGPGGLETTIRFDDVIEGPNTMRFTLDGGQVGSIERVTYKDLGDVAEALHRIADGLPVRTVLQPGVVDA